MAMPNHGASQLQLLQQPLLLLLLPIAWRIELNQIDRHFLVIFWFANFILDVDNGRAQCTKQQQQQNYPVNTDF